MICEGESVNMSVCVFEGTCVYMCECECLSVSLNIYVHVSEYMCVCVSLCKRICV